MMKLQDHVNLVISQTKNTSAYFKSAVNSVQNDVDLLTENIDGVRSNLENTKDTIYAQLISLIAIFVAISFVMFGGMSMMNNLLDFSNMKAVPFKELMSIGALIGIVMLLTIYLFMNFILFLVKESLWSKSNQKGGVKMIFFGSLACLLFVSISYLIFPIH